MSPFDRAKADRPTRALGGVTLPLVLFALLLSGCARHQDPRIEVLPPLRSYAADPLVVRLGPHLLSFRIDYQGRTLRREGDPGRTILVSVAASPFAGVWADTLKQPPTAVVFARPGLGPESRQVIRSSSGRTVMLTRNGTNRGVGSSFTGAFDLAPSGPSVVYDYFARTKEDHLRALSAIDRWLDLHARSNP